MSETSTPYSYEPLKPDCIRILELFSVEATGIALRATADHSLSLQGRLSHHLLDNAPSYDALSYVWGDPKATDKIFLRQANQQIEELGIAANLTKALRTIRSQNQSRFLWIDAICINQKDLAERSEEVRHMHRIYSRAAKVRAWIDTSIEPDNEAIRRLAILSPNHITRFDKADTGMSPIVNVDPNEDSDDDGVGDRAEVWQSLSDLCSDSYWERVWTQQEVRNAADITFHCGSTTIEGEDFAEFLRQLNDRLQTAPEKQAFAHPGDWYEYVTPVGSMLANQSLFHRKQRKLKPAKENASSDVARSDLFATLLSAKHLLKATDNRDYVYGILPLVDDFIDGQLKITIDYELSVKEVYTQVIDTLIRSHRTLHFLTAVDFGASRKDHNLPSWVPDWSCESLRLSLGNNQISPLTEISDHQQAQPYFPSISSDGSTLSVTGAHVGTVARLCENVDVPSTWELETPLKDIASLFHQLRQVYDLACEIQNESGYKPNPLEWSKYASKPDTRLLSILRAITAFECMNEPNYVLENLYEAMDGIDDFITIFVPKGTTELSSAESSSPELQAGEISDSGPESPTEETLAASSPPARRVKRENTPLRIVLGWIVAVPGYVNTLNNRVRTVNWSRQLFISQQGLMGLAPQGAAVGDELWFLPGCNVPILLRPKSGSFLVIGEAHVNDYAFCYAGSTIDEAYTSTCKSGETNFQRISLV